MQFDHATWWPWLCLAPWLGVLLWLIDRARTAAWARRLGPRSHALSWGDPAGRRSRRRRWAVLATLATVVALLAPRWGTPRPPLSAGEADIVIALDVSRSMLAPDSTPTRLERGKAVCATLADRVRGDRLALVLFAGDAKVAVPLTVDIASWSAQLERAGPSSTHEGGTDLGEGLQASLDACSREGRHRAVVVVTDGEDGMGAAASVAAQADERGITIHAVGLGSPRGSKVTLKTPDGSTFLRDREGVDVITALDDTLLQSLASRTGGLYRHADDVDAVTEIYERAIVPSAHQHRDEGAPGRSPLRYQWPLLGALLLWTLELCGSDRRRS